MKEYVSVFPIYGYFSFKETAQTFGQTYYQCITLMNIFIINILIIGCPRSGLLDLVFLVERSSSG